jgi:hypothetical protein
MLYAAVSSLTAWANYYVIIGSSAGALTGLMFVVITLIVGMREQRPAEGIAAFNTPAVVHFGAALAVAAILSAPWQALWAASVPLGLCGLGGVVYTVIVTRRVRRFESYRLVLEDWIWHVLFPLASYGALVVAAGTLPGNPVPTLFVIGTAIALLLFDGIHNAWDNVTYIIARLQTQIKAPNAEGKAGAGAETDALTARESLAQASSSALPITDN